MPYYKDLHEYLGVLEERKKLIRIRREINKDTEMWPMVRLQFRGLPEEERKGFVFENIVDARGRKYDIPVVTCVSGISAETYAIGMKCDPEEITDKWAQAQLNPVVPTMVSHGPVQEEIHIGDTLLEHGGLDEFPIPISTPGFDVAPYLSAPCFVTKDPATGIRNVGTYRAQVKSKTRTGVHFGGGGNRDGAIHWRKCHQLGKPLEAAIVIGGPPNIGYVSISSFPYGTDEFAVAGGISDAPVELVKCKTIDLEVPAHAEIIMEGEISTQEVEPEGPFGEAQGYMARRTYDPFFEIKCITHRKNPIWHTFLSQRTPSESGMIRRISRQGVLFKKLRYDLNMPYVVSLSISELGPRIITIRVKNADSSQIWQTLEAAASFPATPKLVVAVDEDINPDDYESLMWAILTRSLPHRDSRVVKLRASTQDQSAESFESKTKRKPGQETKIEGSCLLIDATLKWPYTPVSLPKKEFMERALQIWNEEDLPPLKLSPLWYGYNLGLWSDEEEKQARLAVKGEYYRTGELMSRRRKKVEIV